MSPASRSKSKDKKAGKEPEKTPSKPSGFTGPVSGYNPLLGKFHALEISHTSTPLSNSNGRFRNIDETDDQSAISLGTGLDFDAVSNNGSWSGESEDTKEKTSSHQASRQESVPGADNEKREKIRQKNEKKHQRQKERRAQELHERCSGFLMSRKLEALSQQLVAMGFTSERATMALILNEGKIEESVAWLFEGVEEEEADRHKESNNLDGGSLKIDITEELAQIVEMEAKYNCSKQEVERAVVACEGDIEKAAETLRLPKEELSFAPPKPEETVDDHSKFPVPRIQPRPPSLSNNMLQQQPRKEEKNFNYTKAAPVPVPIGVLPNVAPSTKAGVAKLEWANPQQISTTMEKRWTNGVGGSNPSVSSYPTAPPIQANPSAKVEARYGLLSSELKHLQLGSIKEPVVVMQRPSHQVIINNQKQQVVSNGNIMSSSPPPLPPSGGWHQNNNNVGGGMMKSGAMTLHNPNPSTRSVSPNSLGANKLYSSHLQYQQQQQHHQQQQQQLNMMVDGSNQSQNQNHNRVNSSWNRMMGTSRTLSAASSLGLFSGLGSNSSSSGSSSPIDWTTSSSMFELDYASVDWSLDRGSRSSVGMWAGGGGGGVGGGGQNSSNNGYHHNNNQGLGGGVGGVRAGGAMRQMVAAVANGGISEMGGFKDNGGVAAATTTTTKAGGEGGGGGSSSGVGVGGGSRGEWSSPFEEKDMFSLSRQFVSSPSL